MDDGSGNVTNKDDADAGGRKAMWSQLKDLVGADIMSKFSIPIFLMEPISVLQKISENMQYCELLDKACDEEEEFMEELNASLSPSRRMLLGDQCVLVTLLSLRVCSALLQLFVV